MLCNSLLDNFYLTDEELQNTPSRKDGFDAETETSLRVLGAQLIQEAAILLRCPQAVAATGQVLLQRFYCQRSFQQYNVKKLAAAATYLAIKLEEVINRIRIRDVVMVFDRLSQRMDNHRLQVLEVGGKEYHNAKETIIRYERDLLRVFGFIVHCDHPHKLLISLIRVLDGPEKLIQEAWKIANDSLRTTLCVRFKSEVVASGVIFYAARRLQIPLPEGEKLSGHASNWWEAFGVKTDHLVQVVVALYELYQRPKAELPKHLAKPARGTVEATKQAAVEESGSPRVKAVTAAPEPSVSKGTAPASPLANRSPAAQSISPDPKATGTQPGGQPANDGQGDDAASKRQAEEPNKDSARSQSRDSRDRSRDRSRGNGVGRSKSRERRGREDRARDSSRRSRSRSRDRRDRSRREADRPRYDRDREPERGRYDGRDDGRDARDRGYRADYRDRDRGREREGDHYRGYQDVGRGRSGGGGHDRRPVSREPGRGGQYDRNAHSRGQDRDRAPHGRDVSVDRDSIPGPRGRPSDGGVRDADRRIPGPPQLPAPMAAVSEEGEENEVDMQPALASVGRSEGAANGASGDAEMDEPMYASEDDEDDRFPQDTGTPQE